MKRQQIIKKIRAVLLEQKVPSAYIFGGFARKQRKCEKINVAIVPPKGKISVSGLRKLEKRLKKEVDSRIDVITLGSISPSLRPYVEKDLVPIYETK